MNSDGTDNIKNKASETTAVPPIISENTAVSTDNPDINLNENCATGDFNTSEESEEQIISEKEKQTESFADENLINLKQPVPKKRENVILQNTIQILLGVIIGAGTGYLLLYLLIPHILSPTQFILILVFIIISLFINLNLYKLGKLISGHICGGEFIAYQLTCLRFYRSEGMLRRRLTPSHFFEGECSFIPPSNGPSRVNIYLAFYTGGVTACFIVGCICIITAIILSVNMSGSVFASGLLPAFGKTVSFIMFLWINSIFSLLYTAFCLIPVFWNDSPSDGLILYALLKKNPYTAQLIILRAVTVQLAAGIRPSDIHIPDIMPVSIIKEKVSHTAGILTAVKKVLNRLFILKSKLKSYLISKIYGSSLNKPKRDTSCGSVKNQVINDTSDEKKASEIPDISQSVEPKNISQPAAVEKAPDRFIILKGRLKSFLIGKLSGSSFLKPDRNINGGSVKDQVPDNTDDAETAAEISDISQSVKPEKISLLTAVKKVLNRLFILTGKLKFYFNGKTLNTFFYKPGPNISDSAESIVNQVKKNAAYARKASKITNIIQSAEPENLSDDIAGIAADKPSSKKAKFNIGVLVYKIKLWFCPRKINKAAFEIEPFPKPAENEKNLSSCTLLLKLYDYYIALDNADHTGMRTNLLMIEENIKRVPQQMLQRVYRELCFYYSIDKNSASAARYMEMMERSTEQKKHIDILRVRAYFEMYINRRYKTAFSICRNAMETAVADSSCGLTVMNRELIRGLVTLIHQKNSLNKNE